MWGWSIERQPGKRTPTAVRGRSTQTPCHRHRTPYRSFSAYLDATRGEKEGRNGGGALAVKREVTVKKEQVTGLPFGYCRIRMLNRSNGKRASGSVSRCYIFEYALWAGSSLMASLGSVIITKTSWKTTKESGYWKQTQSCLSEYGELLKAEALQFEEEEPTTSE
jgi:hypothetical protein